MIRSMREYTALYYPDGHCTTRMVIGWRGTRVESDCGMKGYHITLDGEWRCCAHFGGCDGGCWLDDVLRNIRSATGEGETP